MNIEEKVICPVCKTERGITKRRTIERHKVTFTQRWSWRSVERQCKGTAQPATDEMVRKWIARKIETVRADIARNEDERAKTDDEIVKAQRRSMNLRDVGEQLRSVLAETEAFAAAKEASCD